MNKVGLHAFELDIEKERAEEMAEFCRGRVPLLNDCIEAGKVWAVSGPGGAWQCLREIAVLEAEEEGEG